VGHFSINSSSSRFGSAAEFAGRHGLTRLGQKSLAVMADVNGTVELDALTRLARVAELNADGVLSRQERKRVDSYLQDLRTPIVATPNASSVDVRCKPVKPVEAYVVIEHGVSENGLALDLEISGRRGVPGHVAKRIVLKDITPATDESAEAVRVERYGTRGQNASIGYERNGVGAGYIVGIADKKHGVVLANVSVAGALAGDAPDVHTMLSPAALAHHPAVLELARKQGLAPLKLQVAVLEASFHSDFTESSLHTLALELALTEAGSRKAPRRVQMSALLEGDVREPLSRLKLHPLAAGVRVRAGFVYPSNVKID
jgi:hypothetical protein